MSYLDIYVAAVPTEKRAAWTANAAKTSAVFTDLGATGVVECWGDDVADGELTSFPLAVKCEPHETVVCGWIIWPSKEARNEAWPKAMEDPRLMEMGPLMDGKRMIFGAFEPVFVAGS